MGWFEFSLAYAVSFLSHSLPVRPPVRPWLQARLGASGFTLAYSTLSLAVLAWLIGAAGRAPHVPLWGWAPWQVHLPLIVMGPVSLILAFAIARPNPFSFGGARDDLFDPARPGIDGGCVIRFLPRWRSGRRPMSTPIAIWPTRSCLATSRVSRCWEGD